MSKGCKLKFVVVAKGHKILADYTRDIRRNQRTIVHDWFPHITPGRLTNKLQELNIMWIHEDGDSDMTYLILTEPEYDAEKGFQLLEGIREKWMSIIGITKSVTTAEYGLCDEFEPTFRTFWNQFQTVTGKDQKLDQVVLAMQDVHGNLNTTMEKLLERDESVEKLYGQTQELADTAVVVRKKATAVRKNVQCRGIMLKVGLGVLVVLLLYFFIGLFCGFDMGQCIGGDDNVKPSVSDRVAMNAATFMSFLRAKQAGGSNGNRILSIF
jgi:hypothetical protein